MSWEEVAGMSIKEFARAGLIVTVRSEVLGADVLFVSDNVRQSKTKGREEPIYLARELSRIAAAQPSADGLRAANAVKVAMGGTVAKIEKTNNKEAR